MEWKLLGNWERAHKQIHVYQPTYTEISNNSSGTINFRRQFISKRRHEKVLIPQAEKNSRISFPFHAIASPPPEIQAQDQLDLDVEQNVKNSYLIELSSVKPLNPAIERLLNVKKGISRYRIIFLPEFHPNDPVKRLFTENEWIMMESNWRKMPTRQNTHIKVVSWEEVFLDVNGVIRMKTSRRRPRRPSTSLPHPVSSYPYLGGSSRFSSGHVSVSHYSEYLDEVETNFG
ncbi:6459_t:CDS:2 [Funneliformis mosseae]|uniref:6459_t:CDS:1 n=1 Tax=Funneliformis mosseae TaxID=27381 RepID=A0A9N9FYC8_FUNMO|nr:6459_t:CDS:2 [Funneliformis mosseae]